MDLLSLIEACAYGALLGFAVGLVTGFVARAYVDRKVSGFVHAKERPDVRT